MLCRMEGYKSSIMQVFSLEMCRKGMDLDVYRMYISCSHGMPYTMYIVDGREQTLAS